MRSVFILIIIVFPLAGHSQNYIKSSEKCVLEFQTTEGKRLVIARDKQNRYLVYRFGTNLNIELQYPSKPFQAHKPFHHSFYYRGGGIHNDPMNLNYLYFTIGQYKYVVYEEYAARSQTTRYGIKVINIKTDDTYNIKAKSSTVKGSVSSFRGDRHVRAGDELF